MAADEWYIFNKASHQATDKLYEEWPSICLELEKIGQTFNSKLLPMILGSTIIKGGEMHMIFRVSKKYYYYGTKCEQPKAEKEDLCDEEEGEVRNKTMIIEQYFDQHSDLRTLIRQLPRAVLDHLDIPIVKKWDRKRAAPQLLPSEWREGNRNLGLMLQTCSDDDGTYIMGWPVWDLISAISWQTGPVDLVKEKLQIKMDGGSSTEDGLKWICLPKVTELKWAYWPNLECGGFSHLPKAFPNLRILEISGMPNLDARIFKTISQCAHLEQVALLDTNLPFHNKRQPIIGEEDWEGWENNSITSLICLSNEIISDVIFEISHKWPRLNQIMVTDAVVERLAVEVYSKSEKNGITDLTICGTRGLGFTRARPIKCVGQIRDAVSQDFRAARDARKSNGVAELNEEEYEELLKEFEGNEEELQILRELREEKEE